MPREDYPQDFLDLLDSVKSKRPKTIIQHILAHGSITSEQIEEIYGYKHPPRAIRDVKEEGIPIVTTMVTRNGRRMAEYTFGDPYEMNASMKSSGRKRISKEVKERLIAEHGAIDFIYLERMDPKDLQVDHRIPYEIADDSGGMDDSERFMLLSASANRLKSYACENCLNWTKRDKDVCRCCFWAYPEDYTHVACRRECVIPVMLTDEQDIQGWNRLRKKMGDVAAKGEVTRLVSERLRKEKE